MKRLTAAFFSALLAVSSAGCSQTHNDPVYEEDPKPVESTVKPDDGGSVKMKDYTVPDDLFADAPEADVLSDVVYRSFDPAVILTEPERQPIDGYKCTGFFNNTCYIYKEGDSYGVLSLSGRVLIKADGITKITAESPDMISVKKKDEPDKLYRVSFDGVTPVQSKKFVLSRISFEPKDDGSGYELFIDGMDIVNDAWKEWRSFEQADISALDTEAGGADSEHKYEAVFLADNSKGSYYIAFDKFMNMTVCRAELGFVELKIGGQYGGFYITDPEAYEDLATLVSAFGDENGAPGLPEGSSSSDYVRLVFGKADDPDKSVYTYSPDGYCFTEISSGEGSSRFFRKMSTEAFSDLVYWADSKLNKTGG